jgi:hypothetical protein
VISLEGQLADATAENTRLAAQVEELKGELEQIRIDRVSRSGEFQYAAIHRDRSGQDAGSINYAARVGSIDALADPEKRSIIRCAEQLLDSIRRCMPQPSAPSPSAAESERRDWQLELAPGQWVKFKATPADCKAITDVANAYFNNRPPQPAAAGEQKVMLWNSLKTVLRNWIEARIEATPQDAWRSVIDFMETVEKTDIVRAVAEFGAKFEAAGCHPSCATSETCGCGSDPVQMVGLWWLGFATREQAEAAAAKVNAKPWECASRKQGTAGGNDPAECNHPFCGCDPNATKVVESLQESGWLDAERAGKLRADAKRHEERFKGENRFLSELREALGLPADPSAGYDELRQRCFAEIMRRKAEAHAAATNDDADQAQKDHRAMQLIRKHGLSAVRAYHEPVWVGRLDRAGVGYRFSGNFADPVDAIEAVAGLIPGAEQGGTNAP